jgi:uncharacterized protein affecting Mg2+/Co2+ transport
MRSKASFVVFSAVICIFNYSLLSQEPPDTQIVKYSWAKERIGWESNPLAATIENGSEARERARTERRVTSALEERSNRAAKEEQKKPVEPPRYIFNYKVTVQNNSAKTIKEIDWDYIFTDTATGEVVGRREFTSTEKIGAGKKKELSIRVSSPPALTVSVYKLGENEGAGLTQAIAVLRILYDDGTEWKTN